MKIYYSLTEALKEPDKVQVLDLSNQELTEIPVDIFQLTNLTVLHLEINQLTALPPEIGQLAQLTELHLEGNRLTVLPAEIGQLDQLIDLRLAGNQLTALPPEIGQLAQLTKLYLGSNRLANLPPEIGQLTQLIDLRLGGNQLIHLPPEIDQLTQLAHLGVNDNQLTVLSAKIGQLAQLAIFHIAHNQLTALPPEIGQLAQLIDLRLDGNRLTTLPAEIGQLTELKQLYLRSNRLTHCPPEISQLTQLDNLDLGYNQLVRLPNEIQQLTSLSYLYLMFNNLVVLPAEIGQLTQLTELYLAGNRLTALPAEIRQLTQLATLDLAGNRFSLWPDTICGLTSLQQLNLNSNLIVHLPESIGQLASLTQLHLGRNQLRQIPVQISELTELTSLNLGHNRLRQLPAKVIQMPQLTTLNLDQNLILDPPTEFGKLLAYRQQKELTEQSFQSLFHSIQDLTLVVSKNGLIENINPQGLAWLGYRKEEVLGQALDRLIIPQDLSSAATEAFQLEPSPSIGLNLNPELTQLDPARLGLCLVNYQGKIHYANQQFCHLLGYQKSQLLALSVEDLVPMAERGAHIGWRKDFESQGKGASRMGRGRRIQARKYDGTIIEVEISLIPVQVEEELMTMTLLSRSGGDWPLLHLMSFGFLLAEKSGVGSSNTERHFRHQDGSWLPALLSGAAIYQPDGTFEQVVLSAKDISEQYRQRERLEQAVVERTRELEQAKKEAEEANQAKSQFLSRMSHEIRTPIHGIIGSLDLLSPDTLSTDQQLQIQQAETSANHLLGVINEILDFSRLEAGQMTYSSQPFDLGQTCQQVLGLLRPLAEDKGLSLQLEWAPDLAAARQGDQQKPRQVLINLVANAIKFSTEGSIRLKVESLTAERLRLEVVDTGPGIPAEEQQRLFEAFSQLDETATRAQGALV